MNKTIIIYGSTTGTCEDLAQRIATRLGVDKSDVINVSELTPDKVSEYDNLLLGTSTWGAGDLQDDWFDGLEILNKCNLNDKKVAIFGCGDSSSYGDSFCGGMAQLWNEIKDKGAILIGQVSTDGYSFDDSEAVKEGKFIGLALDEVNESDKTDTRIQNWVSELSKILG